jgi:hypothetical protein
MHYIRFLKPPKIVRNSVPSINAKITITTDLGESFLAADINLLVELVTASGVSLGTQDYEWKGRNGMRALEVCLPFKKRASGELMMWIRSRSEKLRVDSFENVLGGRKDSEPLGGVVSVRSTLINSDLLDSVAGMMAARKLGYEAGEILIWEETGESIARHIWYVYQIQF